VIRFGWRHGESTRGYDVSLDSTGVFIDGGYLSKVLKEFGYPKVSFQKLAKWACGETKLYRAFYYNCLPWQPPVPTPESQEEFGKMQSFFYTIGKIPRLTVRQGKLQFKGYDANGKPILNQKRVDLMLGLDIATMVFHKRVDRIALVAGDSDLLPAVMLAKEDSVLVTLVHGPDGTYHNELRDAADDPIELDSDVIQTLLM
jgi:uncharacterized LabA/DUF88 family protein